MLRILGHEIVKSNWTVEKKKNFWGASCLAYFGSFRMGEILSKSKGGGGTGKLEMGGRKFQTRRVRTLEHKISKNN